MDNKTPVPPYEPNPSYPQSAQQAPLHTADSYTSTPSQPNQIPTSISPMQTGTTNTYPNQPLGSPPIEAYPQQPAMDHPKGDFYGGDGKQVPMQQVPAGQQQQMPMQQSQYHTAIPLQNLGEVAAPADCPCCHQRALTRISHHAGNSTHLWAFLICLCCGLGCIPYLIAGLKDVEHQCGNCGVLLATWKRSGSTLVRQHG